MTQPEPQRPEPEDERPSNEVVVDPEADPAPNHDHPR